MGSEFFHIAGAGAYKLEIFLPELELELRVLDKNLRAKSGAAKFMFQNNLETQLKMHFSNTFLFIITASILMSNTKRNLSI